jgi:hypothetical protein
LSKLKNAISMRRAFAPVARNASEWQASLADPEKEAQERQIGDLMASLGINKHKKKRRNLVYPEAVATDGDRDSSRRLLCQTPSVRILKVNNRRTRREDSSVRAVWTW